MSLQQNPESTYEEIEAGNPLKNIIDKFWSFTCSVSESKPASFFLLPDYSFSLVYIRGMKSGDTEIMLVSPMLKKIKFTFNENIIMAGALIKPMVLNSMFRINGSVYSDKVAKAEIFFGNDIFSKVKDEFSAAINIDLALAAVKKLFVVLKDEYVEPEKKMADILDEIINSGGTLKLEDLYKKYSISPRQFQRKFSLKTGLKPKEFIRILRLSKAATKLVKEGYHHFDVLTEAGYYDQSHYCKEFKSLYGDNPTKFENAQKRIKHINLFN